MGDGIHSCLEIPIFEVEVWSLPPYNLFIVLHFLEPRAANRICVGFLYVYEYPPLMNMVQCYSSECPPLFKHTEIQTRVLIDQTPVWYRKAHEKEWGKSVPCPAPRRATESPLEATEASGRPTIAINTTKALLDTSPAFRDISTHVSMQEHTYIHAKKTHK